MQALTESEAMRKTCPLLKNSCCGSNCMMWRWFVQEFSRKTELWSKSRNTKVNSAFRDDAEWRPVAGEPNDPPPPVGHCALVESAVWKY